MDVITRAVDRVEEEEKHTVCDGGVSGPVRIQCVIEFFLWGYALIHVQSFVTGSLLKRSLSDEEGKIQASSAVFLECLAEFCRLENLECRFCDTSFYGLPVCDSQGAVGSIIGPVVVINDTNNNQIVVYSLIENDVMRVRLCRQIEFFLKMIDTSGNPKLKNIIDQLAQQVAYRAKEDPVLWAVFNSPRFNFRVMDGIGILQFEIKPFVEKRNESRHERVGSGDHPYMPIVSCVISEVWDAFCTFRQALGSSKPPDSDNDAIARCGYRMCMLATENLHKLQADLASTGGCGLRTGAYFSIRRVKNLLLSKLGKLVSDKNLKKLLSTVSGLVFSIFRVSLRCPFFALSKARWCVDSQTRTGRVASRKRKQKRNGKNTSDGSDSGDKSDGPEESFEFLPLDESSSMTSGFISKESDEDEEVVYDVALLNTSLEFFCLLLTELKRFIQKMLLARYSDFKERVSNLSLNPQMISELIFWNVDESTNVMIALETVELLIKRCELFNRKGGGELSIAAYTFIPQYLSRILPRSKEFKKFHGHLEFIEEKFGSCVFTTPDGLSIKQQFTCFSDYTVNIIPVHDVDRFRLIEAHKKILAFVGVRCPLENVLKHSVEFILSGGLEKFKFDRKPGKRKAKAVKGNQALVFKPLLKGEFEGSDTECAEAKTGSSASNSKKTYSQSGDGTANRAARGPSAGSSRRACSDGLDTGLIVESKRTAKQPDKINLSKIATVSREKSLLTGWNVPGLKEWFDDESGLEFPVVVPDPCEMGDSRGKANFPFAIFMLVEHSEFEICKTVGNAPTPFPRKVEPSTASGGDVRNFFSVIPADGNSWKFKGLVWIQEDLVFAKTDFDNVRSKRRQVMYLRDEDGGDGWIYTPHPYTSKKRNGSVEKSTGEFKFSCGSLAVSHRRANSPDGERGGNTFKLQTSNSNPSYTVGGGEGGLYQRNTGEVDERAELLGESGSHSRPLWLSALPTSTPHRRIEKGIKEIRDLLHDDVNVNVSVLVNGYCFCKPVGEGFIYKQFADMQSLVQAQFDDVSSARRCSVLASGVYTEGPQTDDQTDCDFVGGSAEPKIRTQCKASVPSTDVCEPTLESVLAFADSEGYECINGVEEVGLIVNKHHQEVLIVPMKARLTARAYQCVNQFLKECLSDDVKIVGPVFLQYSGDRDSIRNLYDVTISCLMRGVFVPEDFTVYTATPVPDSAESSYILQGTTQALNEYVKSTCLMPGDDDFTFFTLCQLCPSGGWESHRDCPFASVSVDIMNELMPSVENIMHKAQKAQMVNLFQPSLIKVSEPLCDCLFNAAKVKDYCIQLLYHADPARTKLQVMVPAENRYLCAFDHEHSTGLCINLKKKSGSDEEQPRSDSSDGDDD